ncbi:helix-turn-helix transcriptional regulator [Nocardioides sp. GY 10113]|uniref:ArsR/SmtB family transcription factor n=1 Tax=Nocardioides sp. GY 10113 TaxID=2569761 RepID=UPI0010A83733|nr:helix-turn-helix domain-containing protein [Nocardioides sp. GY 10113]TIC87490.1 helix-turn-helix transcriptional regulator [Nocardioides sp. GY 10113]
MVERPSQHPGTSTLRATAHPLRLRILSLLTGAAMSAAEVARELGISHANASYHLRQLHDADLIVVEGEERIRGGVAKRYRYRTDHPEPPADQEQLPLDVRAMSDEMLRRLEDREPEGALFTDAELWVEPEVWDRVRSLVQQASYLLHDSARRPRSAGTIRTSLTVAAFRMGPDDAPEDHR